MPMGPSTSRPAYGSIIDQPDADVRHDALDFVGPRGTSRLSVAAPLDTNSATYNSTIAGVMVDVTRPNRARTAQGTVASVVKGNSTTVCLPAGFSVAGNSSGFVASMLPTMDCGPKLRCP